jgi:hypothetical protein
MLLLLNFFFLGTGSVPKDPEAQLIKSGGGTTYNTDHKEIRNYNKVFTFCTRDPRSKTESAIRSNSISTASQHITAKNAIAEDITTWDGAPGACCDGAKRPPLWHDSLEVEEYLQPPVGRNRRW